MRSRYARSGLLVDLLEAVKVYQAAVEHTPVNSPDRPSRLNNLGTGFIDRFACTGQMIDLEEGRNVFRSACELGNLISFGETLRSAAIGANGQKNVMPGMKCSKPVSMVSTLLMLSWPVRSSARLRKIG